MSAKLKNIISLLVEQELKNVEAPEDAPFGQYLFANPEPRRIRKDDVEEYNTAEEETFLHSLKQHYESEMDRLESDFKSKNGLYNLKRKGLYSEYIDPPKQDVYRAITVDIKTASTILKIDEMTIRQKAQTWFEVGSGVLSKETHVSKHKKTNNIMSWSISVGYLHNFVRTEPGEILILFVANPYEGGNDFYLNPTTIVGKFNTAKISPYIRNEMETISYGPVSYKNAFVFPNVPSTEKTQALKPFTKTFISMISSMEQKVQDINSNTSKDKVQKDDAFYFLLRDTIEDLNEKFGKFRNSSDDILDFSIDFNDIFDDAIYKYTRTKTFDKNQTIENYKKAIEKGFNEEQEPEDIIHSLKKFRSST